MAVELVEAAGQLFHLFRGGLDYAFILLPGCGACYPPLRRILVPAHLVCPGQRVYESLQGKPEVGPLLTPRRFHAASRRRRVRRCEPRFHSALSGRGNRTDRTRVRKSYTFGTTCLARSFGSRLAPAGRQADAQPVASTDPHGQATRPWERLMSMTLHRISRLGLRLAYPSGLAHQQASAASSRC